MSTRSILTVSQLTTEIKSLLERNFDHVWVEGEVSNLRLPSSGHLYFTLKDGSSQIRAVMFRLQNRLLKFEPEDGLQVICYGRVSVYEPRGEYQIVVDFMEPKGLGALQLAFEQLKEKLAREGLFDPVARGPFLLCRRKSGSSPRPQAPPSGICCASSTGVLPIFTSFFTRCASRGRERPRRSPRRFDALNQISGVDVLIVGRGGGSLEDLWAFNEEVVARAIFPSRIPVISAVGHEIDFTIADFVADLRASTPSAAAELVVRNKVDLAQNLETLERLLWRSFRSLLEFHRERLFSFGQRLADPRRRLSDQRMRLDDFSSRLGFTLQQALLRKMDRFKLHQGTLLLLQPGKQAGEYAHRDPVRAASVLYDPKRTSAFPTKDGRGHGKTLHLGSSGGSGEGIQHYPPSPLPADYPPGRRSEGE